MKSFMFKLTVVLAAVFVSQLLAPPAMAQFRAGIQGVVQAPDQSVVPGATVTLVNNATNQKLTTTTNASGVYNFSGLPPSTYTLTVEMKGFKKKVLDKLSVIAEQVNAVNVQLELGQVTQTVTVTDATPVFDTETANLSGTVSSEDIQKLPSFGRDPFQLLQLAPGAFGDGARTSGGGGDDLPSTTVGGTGGTDGIFKIENGGQITANGGRTGENNYTIDGVGTTSVTWGGTSVITPNEDSIKEVKIVTDNYDAENGRYLGAQVQIISKSGTNQYHGSLFFKAHRPGLDAFTSYNGYPGDCCGGGSNVRDADRFNDMGATAGGPILKNKLFVFFAYETLSNNAAATTTNGWYETSQYRALAPAGSNAAKFFAFPGAGPNGGTILDQTCASIGLVEGTNCHMIPGQGLNLGQPLNPSAFPLGTQDPGYTGSSSPGTGGNGSGGANNLGAAPDIAFFQNIPNPSNSTHRAYNGRVDFNATAKDLVTFSLYYVPNTTTLLNGNGVRAANLFHTGNTNRAATLLWDHTFSPTVVNEARANAAGWMDKDLPLNPNAPFGLPQTVFNATGGISVNGFGVGSFNGFDQWTYAGKDVLTKVHGAHTMKMGGEFTRLLSVDGPFWAARPTYTFNNMWDFLNDAPVLENAQFDPKTGVPSALRKDVRDNLWGLFFQDDYKARANLTLTAGLRWEYFGAITEKTGKLATVVLGTGTNLFTDLSDRTGGHQFTPQKTNFGPDLGFAWSPGKFAGHEFGSRLVLRGGFGIAYNGIVQSNTLDTRFNPPFVDNVPNLSGSQILYINSFSSNVHNPFGYASNPNGKVTFASNNLPTTCCVDLVALPANWPTTYMYHYSLDAEYDLGHQWVASIGYQGSSTRHLTDHYNLYDTAAAHGGIPFNPVVHGVTYYVDDGSAGFNALLLELKHNFGQSFSLDTQYRLSHCLDPGSNAYAGGFYQWDTATGFASCDYDTRNAFKMFGIWSPRIFSGSHGWLQKIVGGWSLSGILNAHSGFPWTPQYNFQGASDFGVGDPVFNFGGPGTGGSSSDSGSAAFLPAKYLGGFTPNYISSAANAAGGSALFTPPNVSGGTLFTCLFPNPPVSACPTGQQGFGPLPTFPGIARNAFTGPGYADLDSTLSKSFGLPHMPVLGENAKLEVRANFYNLFNTLNLNGSGLPYTGGIESDIMDPHFGEAETALGSRTIELQARFSF